MKVCLVIVAVGVHPVPSRTRQLSPPAPMVLGGQPLGRVGHRQGTFFVSPLAIPLPNLQTIETNSLLLCFN